jgi:hypothetical protein
MFANKTYLSGAPFRKAPAFIGKHWKSLSGANNLAYLACSGVKRKKSFFTVSPDFQF